MLHTGLTIGGKTRYTAQSFPVIDPATGLAFAEAPDAGLELLEEAVAAAHQAFPLWRDCDDGFRQQACRAIAGKIEHHAEELAQLLTREQGKPLNGLGSRFEVGGAVAWARATAELSLKPRILQDDAQGRVELHRKPIGVVGSITPWNWPLMIAIWHVLPAIRAGNTVVIKPSPFTPLSTLAMIALIAELLPPGVINCVSGLEPLGSHLARHPDIGKMVFTGSTATGRKVYASCADTIKRLTLELGGNDAGIILPDCNPKAIAHDLFWGAFINNGQTCAALKRLYVPDALYEDVCAALVEVGSQVKLGPGLDENNELGPVQNKMQFDKVEQLVSHARQGGGRILLGGHALGGPGYFYPPTLVADVENGMPLVDLEQFGPALPLVRYHSVDEALQFANDNPNGLGGSVWGTDLTAAKALAQKMECGSVWVNRHGAIQPNAPFGGVKQSGLGVEFGQEGLEEYTTVQTVFG